MIEWQEKADIRLWWVKGNVKDSDPEIREEPEGFVVYPCFVHLYRGPKLPAYSTLEAAKAALLLML